MKKIILLIIALTTIISCGSNGSKKEKETIADSTSKDCIEVIYFHGKKRCITCNAIESLTKEVVETDFAEELKNQKVVFKIIDISLPENEAVANKYEVTWSSLFINKWKNGEESVNNLTDFGFANAKNSKDKFKDGVKSKISELLK